MGWRDGLPLIAGKPAPTENSGHAKEQAAPEVMLERRRCPGEWPGQELSGSARLGSAGGWFLWRSCQAVSGFSPCFFPFGAGQQTHAGATELFDRTLWQETDGGQPLT